MAGSDEAFHDLVVRYQRPVYSVILRMVQNPQLAEDLAQEAFLKAYRHLKTFDPKRKLSSWLFKIAHNTTLDHLRRRSLDTVPLEVSEDGGDDHRSVFEDERAESPDQRVERSDMAKAIEGSIGRLRPEYREIVVLRFQEGLAYQEIADILGLPMGTVKTHLHRARHQLAVSLAEAGLAPQTRAASG